MQDSFLRLDTAVIGGGITGLYACLKLRETKGPRHEIALFEVSDRFGGRIETVEMDGFLAEYGPMRFEKKAQPLLMELIRELGLETCYFPPYMAAIDRESLFNLYEDENRAAPEESEETLFTTLELLTLGILRILKQSGGDLDNPRDPRHWEWWAGLDENFYHLVRNEITFNGEPLYNAGFWNVLSEVLSHRALIQIIHYGTFYHVIHHNPNAAEWIIFWLRGLHPNDELVGIKQGSESLIRELVKRLSSPGMGPVPLHLNCHLISILPENDTLLLELRTNHGKKIHVHAKRAVLALPRCPLTKLAPLFPELIQTLIDAVIPIPLFKCFFVTKNPWWDGNTRPQTRASCAPCRELHYYYRETGNEKRGMVMVYGDGPSRDYWKVFVGNPHHLSAELNQDRRLLESYVKYLCANPAVEDPREKHAEIESITSFGIRDWSREPFEGGCHIWKAGTRVEEAIDALTGFSLTGNAGIRNNVHICGEAYSDFQGFIEGGLRTVHTMIRKLERQ